MLLKHCNMYIQQMNKWLQRNKVANSNTCTCRTRNAPSTFAEYFSKFCYSTCQLPSLICYWRASKYQCTSFSLSRKRRWWNCSAIWIKVFEDSVEPAYPLTNNIKYSMYQNMGHETHRASIPLPSPQTTATPPSYPHHEFVIKLNHNHLTQCKFLLYDISKVEGKEITSRAAASM